MKRILTFVSALACLAWANGAFAYQLSGNVTCERNGSPLAGLTVNATQASDVRSATTGTDGSWAIGHDAGDWIVSVVTDYTYNGPRTENGTFVSGINFQVDDPACWACGDFSLDPGEQCDDGNVADGDGCSALCTIEQCGNGILDPGEQCDDGNLLNGDGCSATCEFEQGGEGCTPGYWRQRQHFDSYPDPYTYETPFWQAFEYASEGDGPFGALTLPQAARLKGGGINALGRHAVAALLNAASDDVEYDRSVASVIATFKSAVISGDYETAKNIFASFNEQSCPLN